MKLYQLVVKDILRRKKRFLYAMLGVVVATMTVVSILTIADAGEARIYQQLEKYGANLNVIPAIDSVDVSLGSMNLGALSVGENYIPEDKLVQLREITDGEISRAFDIESDENLATIAPKLFIQTSINEVSLMLVGIDPDQEKGIRTWWHVQGGSYLQGETDVLAGSQTAEVLGLSPGDIVQLQNRTFTISGVLEETGSGDDYQIFASIGTVQSTYGKEGVISSVDIRALCNGCPVETIAARINENITGVRAIAVTQVAKTEMGMMDKMNSLMLALAGITLVIGSFGVLNTMMTSVHERIKDIGIMRSVGASRRQIIQIFLFEALVMGLLGGLAGFGAGTLVAYGLGPVVFEGTSVNVIPVYLPMALGLAVVVSVLATLFPAYRATTIKVSDSFRSL